MRKNSKGGIIMLTYSFMRIAFFVAILLGISLPLVGSTAVYKRLSSSGDALAHSSLAGVAIGLAAGLNPLVLSIIACVVSFLIIELLRKKFQKFSELGVAVVLSASIGVAGILSHYAKSANFDSYLFGSIILIGQTELILTIVLTALVILFSFLFYPHMFASLYSEKEAKVNGVKVNLLYFFHSLLLSVTIAVGAKVVGSLVVSSMIVLPTAIALLLKRGYKVTMILSLVFSLFSMLSGLTLSYYMDWAPGATIVVTTISLLVVILLYKGILSLVTQRKIKKKESRTE